MLDTLDELDKSDELDMSDSAEMLFLIAGRTDKTDPKSSPVLEGLMSDQKQSNSRCWDDDYGNVTFKMLPGYIIWKPFQNGMWLEV